VELYEVARLSVSSDPHAISLAGKVANFNFDAVQELAASVSQGSDKIIAMGSAGEMKSVTFQVGGTNTYSPWTWRSPTSVCMSRCLHVMSSGQPLS
jgi:hypothetical protein